MSAPLHLPRLYTKNAVARFLNRDVRSSFVAELQPVAVLQMGDSEVELYAADGTELVIKK